ncbi:MAG: hypothetical protein EOP45_23410, partial [Sphingobacteriaceae bacterium]
MEKLGSSIQQSLQIQFINKIMRRPYDCIIAGGFPSRDANILNETNECSSGDIDIYVPDNIMMSTIIQLARDIFLSNSIFTSIKPMMLQSEHFCEIWFPSTDNSKSKNIQLIHKPSKCSTKKFAYRVLDDFDLTYCCAAIYFDRTLNQLIWACTTAFHYAQETGTTYFLNTRNNPSQRRIDKAKRLGFTVLYPLYSIYSLTFCDQITDDRLIHQIRTEYYNTLFHKQEEDEDLWMIFLDNNTAPRGGWNEYRAIGMDRIVNNALVEGFFYTNGNLLTSEGTIQLHQDWAFLKDA